MLVSAFFVTCLNAQSACKINCEEEGLRCLARCDIGDSACIRSCVDEEGTCKAKCTG